ncbi:MAG: homoserine dehydrogenase [Cytophagales bacterium]|nr:homoserine dehydrogenase [Cytophagales bacterium]
MKKLRIGLFGFGVVGEGIYQVLSQKSNMDCEIVKICIKNPSKTRNAPDQLFTDDRNEILQDSSINVVVELIDDADVAYEIVVHALETGKCVVSANKKMIADNLTELIKLQKKSDASFLYEAAVCGSIPIVRNLEEYFDNDLLKYVTGIVNGSTNYILSQMSMNGSSYSDCLKDAQTNGFAETNPTLDVEGIDASYKMSIICLHAFGKIVDSSEIMRKGITSLTEADFKFAKEKGMKIKLIANTFEGDSGLCTTIFPTFLKQECTLSFVENEYNGVLIGSSLADEQLLYGKGAGRFPTSSAVLSDISALRYGYKYEFRKGQKKQTPAPVGSKKVYASFKSGKAINIDAFESIEEQYKNEHTEYIIGNITLDQLSKSDFLTQKDISVIAFG